MKSKFKKAQEEMIGFVLIIVIVLVILLIFLSLSLRSPQKENIESYEVESFIQAFLQYTTDCENNIERLSIQDLVFSCDKKETCADSRESCEVLKITLTEIVEESWKTRQETPIKGYSINITSENSKIFGLKEGNITGNSKGAVQYFSKAGRDFSIMFIGYY